MGGGGVDGEGRRAGEVVGWGAGGVEGVGGTLCIPRAYLEPN